MARLIHKKKVVLPNMKYVSSFIGIGIGLMFASEEKVKKGMCLVLPGKKDKKGFRIDMVFCKYPYEILFLNSEFKVIDKTVLKPWKIGYAPKKPFKYAIESWPGTFKGIKVGDTLAII